MFEHVRGQDHVDGRIGQIDLLRRKVAAGLTLSVDVDPLDML